MQIDLQLKYVQSKFKKNCIYHRKQSQLFCFKLNCVKCPYMCQLCNKENIHMHKDNIGNLNEFLRQMIIQLHDYERFYKNIGTVDQFSTNVSINQQTELLKSIQKLQNQIIAMISMSKQKIKKQIENNIQNLKKTNINKLKFYKNPNILINKLISQSSTDFITKLKKSLNDRLQYINASNQKSIYNNQITLLKTNIKHILDMNLLDNKNRLDSIQHKLSQMESKIHLNQQKIYQLPIVPKKIYNFNNKMVVCGQKTYLFDLELNKNLLIQYNLNLCSFNKMRDQFIGISLPNNLYFHTQNHKKTFKIKNDCTALGFLIIKEQFYAIVGYQDGQIQAYSINNKSLLVTSKKHNAKINNISILYNQNIIICSSKDSKISLYQFKYQQQSLKIEFITFLVGTMDELLGHEIFDKQIILYNAGGNIKIINLELNQIIFQSSLVKEKSIIDVLIVPSIKGLYLLVAYKNEKQLKIWNIDRERSSYKIQNTQFYLKNSEISKNNMFIWNDNLWIIKQSEPQISIASIQYY